ncbi:MAG TPA: diaminopimelate epimerase [Phycisphaerae bacterium]|nr:diaminopimelate epimerase [Phycisphaerae bacterium]
MASFAFTKMHGLGNDYIYVDCFREALNGVDRPALARDISDRHRGVGSDGLILICPPDRGVDAVCRMEMYNADGSRGEMCGNGIRCVAKYVVEHAINQNRDRQKAPIESELNHALSAIGEPLGLRDITATDLRIQTDRGVLSLTAFSSDRVVQSVRVDMGAPILSPAKIPVKTKGDRCIREPIEIGGRSLAMTCVSMGNPHAVFFVESFSGIDVPALGALVERHPSFPNRVNAHFVTVQSRVEATMKTWERGSGITQACGTGACAVLVAGVLEGRLDSIAHVHLPGGDLRIEWPDGEGGSVFMTGPAEEVFSGVWHV